VTKAGPGSNYVQAFKDKDGNRLDGGQPYRLHVPADVPAAAFWSLTFYDTATRSMVQNATNDAAHSSYDNLQTKADGSVDLYFGPKRQRAGKVTGSTRSLAKASIRCSVLQPQGVFV